MSKLTASAFLLAVALCAAPVSGQTPAPSGGARSGAPATPQMNTAPSAKENIAPMMVMLGKQGTVPITQRMPSTNYHGVIVEITCFRTMGAAKAAAADEVACAKAALTKGDGVLGILTDGDGMFQIAGPLTAANYGKLAPYVGKELDVAGSEVYLSNNFSYRVFEVNRFTPGAAAKK